MKALHENMQRLVFDAHLIIESVAGESFNISSGAEYIIELTDDNNNIDLLIIMHKSQSFT